MKLLLAPEKIITSTSEDVWLNSGSSKMILLTSGDNQQYISLMKKWSGHVFHQVECFKSYAINDFLCLRALELINEFKITKIIAMSEADIMRSANMRELFDIEGHASSDAVLFRDKIMMKDHAAKNHVPVPRYKCIKDGADIVTFIERVNYPVVIKPILGRGSQNTFIIRNESELRNKLDTGFISDTCRRTDLLAEEYIDGDVYHLDGLVINHEIRVISVSKYVNNCLAFVNGEYLGSYTLDDANYLKAKLSSFGRHLVEKVFPFPAHSLFHIELFVDKQDRITLCEIACRLGGNGINDEVMLQQRVDIKMAYIRAECGVTAIEENVSEKANIAARVLIPPKEAKLLFIPTSCDLNGVLRYQSRGVVGRKYRNMSMSNDEVANFLLVGQNEVEIQEKINCVVEWFYQNSKWEFSAELKEGNEYVL